jgi:hypothetical protein
MKCPSLIPFKLISYCSCFVMLVCGCETWSLTLREEHRLTVFENRVLRSPVSIAARSKASTVFGRSNIGIAGLNPAQGMYVCPCFSVLCCPV